jgi:hypothetical protein
VVAANSATDDPECISDITLLGSRYLVMVVGTEDAILASALSAGAATGVTFSVTLVFTAVVTAIVLILIFLFCFRRSANTPYAILVVAANSATDDPECISDITLLGSRYLV